MENSVIKEIKNLKQEINPRPEWVTLSRDLLLKEINPNHQYQKVSVGTMGWAGAVTQSFRQRMFEPALMMLLILGAFVGSSLLVNAAFYSLPGDNLYRMKIALEKTHVAFVTDEERKVELKMEFAQKRVAEFDKIVAQANVSPEVKKKKIEEAVKEFKNNVTQVSSHLTKSGETQVAGDGVTVKMALTISQKTEELAKVIDKTTGSLGEDDKKELEGIIAEAVQSVHDANETARQVIDQSEEENIEESSETEAEGEVKGSSNEATVDSDNEISTSTSKIEAGLDEAEDTTSEAETADIN